MKRLLALMLATALLGLVPAAQAEAKAFKNCADLRKTHKYGVSLSSTAVNKGAGPIFTPRVNSAIYRLNKKMDIDRDNIICEVMRPNSKPAVVMPTPTPQGNSEVAAGATTASRFIQMLIDITPTVSKGNKTRVIVHVEAGKNGAFPGVAESSLTAALGFYASLGMALPQEAIHVILGRTQAWIREKANTYAPGCVGSEYRFIGSASLCAYPNRAAIYSHLPTAVTMNSAAPDDLDFSDESTVLRYTNRLVLDSFAGAAPHEAHHAWQDGNFGNSGAVPKWLWEGGASIFSEMVRSKLQPQMGGYLSFTPGSNGWGKDECRGPVETMKPVCEYTQGIVVMEYFLFRFGVDAYTRLITQGNKLDFPVRFEMATKTVLTDFYKEVNDYLTLKGWNF